MKTILLSLITVLSVVVSVYLYSNRSNAYQVFYPVYKNENGKYYSKKNYSEDSRSRILKVFDYYDIDYKVEVDKILVRKGKNASMELLKNYTTKSTDTIWWNTHILNNK